MKYFINKVAANGPIRIILYAEVSSNQMEASQKTMESIIKESGGIASSSNQIVFNNGGKAIIFFPFIIAPSKLSNFKAFSLEELTLSITNNYNSLASDICDILCNEFRYHDIAKQYLLQSLRRDERVALKLKELFRIRVLDYSEGRPAGRSQQSSSITHFKPSNYVIHGPIGIHTDIEISAILAGNLIAWCNQAKQYKAAIHQLDARQHQGIPVLQAHIPVNSTYGYAGINELVNLFERLATCINQMVTEKKTIFFEWDIVQGETVGTNLSNEFGIQKLIGNLFEKYKNLFDMNNSSFGEVELQLIKSLSELLNAYNAVVIDIQEQTLNTAREAIQSTTSSHNTILFNPS